MTYLEKHAKEFRFRSSILNGHPLWSPDKEWIKFCIVTYDHYFPDLLLVVPQLGHQLGRDVLALELFVGRKVALARAALALEEEGLGQPLAALHSNLG